MLGETVSHYRILEEVGRGGMGVVYKAHDTKLDRLVALKFLPHHINADEDDKKRFILEAKAASSLDHPNICNIHEIDETEDGQMFICMAYYEGETLKKRIERGPMAVEDCLDVALQIAHGVTKAHEHGIVHRDLKPANVIITKDGVAKIVDFGLAKLAGRTRVTKEGATVGTVAYMSPEQARGHDVDHRTDIWSFGVVLYQMLTGHLPFASDYDLALVYSILNEKPQSISSKRAGIPHEVENIVDRCLAKEPSARYLQIAEFVRDVHRLKGVSQEVSWGWMSAKKTARSTLLLAGILLALLVSTVGYFLFRGRPVAGQERISVAVADFVNMTNEEELNGLSGLLITSLEQSRRLAVLTRPRMFDILQQIGKGDAGTIDEMLGREICKQANVSLLVTASIQRLGRRYAIDLKVLDTDKDEYVFTTKEEGEGQENIFSMIDRLAERTRRGAFTEKDSEIHAASQKVAEVLTTSFDAYHHYFVGEQLMKQKKLGEAEKEFGKAIELDSTFGLGYYRLAHLKAWYFGEEEPAQVPMQKALALIDRIPEKYRYLVRAQEARFEKGFEASIAILKEMEQYYPDDEEMLYDLGYWSYWAGHYAVAAEYLEKFLQHDPSHQQALQRLIETYEQLGEYQKMNEIAKRHVEIARSPQSYGMLAISFMNLNENERAIQTLDQSRQLFPDDHNFVDLIANCYMLQGKYEHADTELRTLIDESKPAEVQQVGQSSFSILNLYRGKYREALRYRDGWIRSTWHKKDTSWAAIQQFEKAHVVLWGWNDEQKATREVQDVLELKNGIHSPFFWMRVASFYAFTGQYALGDSIGRSISKNPSLTWFHEYLTGIIRSLQQQCSNVGPVTDHPMLRGGYRHFRIILFYLLATCQFEKGEFDQALESLRKIKTIYVNYFGLRAVFYPKSLYLQGRIYEQKGDRKRAIDTYREFLSLWKDADQDLPDLIDAKTRLAKLRGV